jgi:hypothetical protein
MEVPIGPFAGMSRGALHHLGKAAHVLSRDELLDRPFVEG